MITTYLATGYSLERIFDSFLGREPEAAREGTDTDLWEPGRPLPRLTYPKMFKFRPQIAQEQIKQLLYVRKIFSELMKGNWEFLIEQRWLKTTGLFTTAGIEQYLREEVLPSNRFEDYLATLFIVATQLNHSRKIVFGKYKYAPPPSDPSCQYINETPVSEAIAASTSLPFIYSPYFIRHKDGSEMHYIDGEIRDTLSTHVAVDAGADLIFASYTHQPYHYVKTIGSLTEFGLPAILIQSIYLVIEQKINNHIQTLREKNNAVEAVLKYCKQHGLSDEHRRRLGEILEEELHFRKDVNVIYIHPKANDHQMFTREHFSLSPRKMTDIVRSGFKAAIDVLRKYEFADRREGGDSAQVTSIA